VAGRVCAINVRPKGAGHGADRRDGPYGEPGQRSDRVEQGVRQGDGICVRVLSVLLGAAGGASLQDELSGLRILYVLLGFLLSRARPSKGTAADFSSGPRKCKFEIIQEVTRWRCE